jgi:hypothetical protein
MCAIARDESTRINSYRLEEREAFKQYSVAQKSELQQRRIAHSRERERRWNERLAKSPFRAALADEYERIDRENRLREEVTQRRAQLESVRARTAHNGIFRQAVAGGSVLEGLRREKRDLIQAEKHLRALRDVDKTNARTAQILENKTQDKLRQRQKKLEAMLNEA